MRYLALVICFLLSRSLFAEDLQVVVGMPKDKALAIIKANGGKDITPGLAIVGPKGEHPLHDFYWSLDEYNAVIAISGKEKVDWLLYWTEKDFAQPKMQRSKAAKQITAFKINPSKKQFVIEEIVGAAEETEPSIASVSFKMGDKWITAKELDAQSSGFISALDKEFRRQGLLFKLFVDPDSDSKRYFISYHSGIGHKKWTVFCSKDGAFSGYHAGIARDTVEFPSGDELYKKFKDAVKDVDKVEKK